MIRETLSAMGVALVICALGACSAPKHYVALPVSGQVASPASDRCDEILSKERTWKTVAAVAGILGGGGGLATIPIETQSARTGVAVGAILVGAVSAGSVFLSENYASDFRDHRCAELTSTPP